MIFSSAIFLFLFLPILLVVYHFADHRYRNLVLLAASLAFYVWGEPKNIVLMLLSIFVNYGLGICIDKKRKYGKCFLTLSVIFNLGLLFVFKYLNFTVGIWNQFVGEKIDIPPIALPIGISFFTFQIMSYVIDVYRKEVEAQKNILDLALYISLFPQLIAGPIVRYIDVKNQIENRETGWEIFYQGIIRFAVGFSKKVLIADQLAPLADSVFAGHYLSLPGHWVGVLAYTLQIYFDFSGYSDMAIGLGKMFGFDFLENFNYPYISKSIKEFWRRWHISLSSWFRDYLYIPLGGSRQGKIKTYRNLMIVFMLTGLWHGASFNFIVWGLFYALFLIAERLGLERMLKSLPRFFQHLYTLFIVMIGWVFFRAEGLYQAITFLKAMFIPQGNDIANLNMLLNPQYLFFMAAGIFFSAPHTRIKEKLRGSVIGCFSYDLCIITTFLFAIVFMVGSGYSPFLYFRF